MANKGQKPNKHKKKYKKPIKIQTLMLIGATIGITIILGYSAFKSTEPAKYDLEYSEFQQMLDDRKIESADIINSEDSFIIRTEDGETYNVVNPDYEDFRKELLEAGVDLNISQRTAEDAVLSTLSSLPMIMLCFVLIYFVFKSVGGQATTLFKVLKPEDIITFDDVAGMSETKEEVEFAVSQLVHAKELEKFGARPCKGIILEGPPGTGKTLLAKAIAGEAGVPFISTSGADFIEMFVGLGAARVRALWDLALANAPCVVFIDEIDAVGRRRQSGGDAASVESNQTLNALLQRMDGLGVGSGVFVVAATNRIEDLDPALLRPGRFDKHLYIGPPKSKKDRDEVIKVHMKNKKFSEDFDFDKASKLMFGLTGAQIEQVLNEAALISLKNDKKLITTEDIDSAVMKLLASGVAIKHTSESDRDISAVHEAGHAVANLALGRAVSKVSIMPYSSGIGGITVQDTDDIENKRMKTKSELLNDIKVMLAGQEAERLIFGDTSIGCSNDIEKATMLAFNIVNSFAMTEDSIVNISALSKIGVGIFDNNETVKKINEILLACRHEVTKILSANKNAIQKLRDELLQDETVINVDKEVLGIIQLKD